MPRGSQPKQNKTNSLGFLVSFFLMGFLFNFGFFPPYWRLFVCFNVAFFFFFGERENTNMGGVGGEVGGPWRSWGKGNMTKIYCVKEIYFKNECKVLQ